MATKLGVNLVVDSGAEQATPNASSYDAVVPIPGWTTTSNMTVDIYGESGGDLTVAEAPPNGGSNYFYGGPNNASSSASQTIKIKGLTSEIKTGGITATISGYLGGFGTQNDHADIDVTFLTNKGKVIGSTTVLGPTSFPSGSSLTFETATVTLPKGTAEVTYTLVATKEQESDNDGLADNLSFVLNKATGPTATKTGTVSITADALNTQKMNFLAAFTSVPAIKSALAFSDDPLLARTNPLTDFSPSFGPDERSRMDLAIAAFPLTHAGFNTATKLATHLAHGAISV